MISEEYKKILTSIHSKTKFGKRRKLPDYLEKFIADINPKSILDFGCGKGNLVETLRSKYPARNIFGYDPANPEYDKSYPFVDLIVSTDVLEHIEPDLLDKTFYELSQKSKYVYHLISCAPAKLILPDGRNAHLIQQEPKWWKDKFSQFGYEIIKEDYKVFSKFSKQLKKDLPVKNFYLMAENKNG